VVDGSAIVPTVFLHVLGYDHITIGAASTSTWGNTRLRSKHERRCLRFNRPVRERRQSWLG
jgi:hypothetical protein